MSDGLRRIKRLGNIQVSSLLLTTAQKKRGTKISNVQSYKSIVQFTLYIVEQQVRLTNGAQTEKNGLIDDLSKTMFFFTNPSD